MASLLDGLQICSPAMSGTGLQGDTAAQLSLGTCTWHWHPFTARDHMAWITGHSAGPRTLAADRSVYALWPLAAGCHTIDYYYYYYYRS